MEKIMRKNLRVSIAYLLGAIASFAMFTVVKSNVALWLSGSAAVTFMALTYFTAPE